MGTVAATRCLRTGAPRFDEIDPAQHVRPAVMQSLERLRDGLENAREETWEELTTAAEIYEVAVDEVERASAPLQFSWGLTNHLMGVVNTDTLREAHEELLPSVIAQSQAIQQSSVLFDALTRQNPLKILRVSKRPNAASSTPL